MPADPDLQRFSHSHYLVRRKILRIFGGAFHIYDADGNVVLYCHQKRFKLREDLRVYASEEQQTELLKITTKSIFDISGTYDVIDSVSDERVGSLRRSGISSMFMRDHWTVLDGEGNEIGEIHEDSMLKALARRFVDAASLLMPQAYHVTMAGQTVAELKQNFNPFVYKLNVDFTGDRDVRLDRRLGLAAAILLAAIEGKQD